jgi:hypothetical protein
MDQRLADLLELLELEQLEINLFRGESRDIGSAQVFGGQVLGQALSAAAASVDAARIVHSLHAYFLRRGDCKAPIVYQVDRSLDGHSFSNRRVVAIQHGRRSSRRLVPGGRSRLITNRHACRASSGRACPTMWSPPELLERMPGGCGASSTAAAVPVPHGSSAGFRHSLLQARSGRSGSARWARA